jgi:hypothetical protein
MDRSLPKLLLAACTLALVAIGLMTGALPDRAPRASGPTDIGLYAHAVEAARHPSTWYAAVAGEQRAEGYPLKPFVALRPPTLAFVLSVLPGEAARRLALDVLALGVLAAWTMRLKDELRPLSLSLAVLALATGLAPVAAPQAYLMHETWAGLLIALSLALWRPGRFGWSLAAAVAAVLIRELAAPYLLAMGAMALAEHRRREALAWSGALAAFGVLLALHARMVAAVTLPTDLASQGWMAMGGWPFVLHALQWNAVLALSPAWLAAVLIPLALTGAAAGGGRLGLVLLGYGAALTVLGRPENAYWGLILTPLLPLGLITLPRMRALPSGAAVPRAQPAR